MALTRFKKKKKKKKGKKRKEKIAGKVNMKLHFGINIKKQVYTRDVFKTNQI